MKITFGKNSLDLDSITSDTTIFETKSMLKEMTGFDSIRLIQAGKTLNDETIINQLPGGIHSTLVMIASKKEDIHESDILYNKRVKNDLEQDFSSESKFTNHHRKTAQDFIKDGYGFHGIEVLPNLPYQDKAREILESLASDPGFLAVMKRHRWNVGSLCELYPEGYVGVSDVCILGLNQNKGEKILLRIRTDDLKGFRKILNIRDVLCHELTHNMHSDHNDDFYRLYRIIQKEVTRLDWTKSKFYRLIDAKPDSYIDDEVDHVDARDDSLQDDRDEAMDIEVDSEIAINTIASSSVIETENKNNPNIVTDAEVKSQEENSEDNVRISIGSDQLTANADTVSYASISIRHFIDLCINRIRNRNESIKQKLICKLDEIFVNILASHDNYTEIGLNQERLMKFVSSMNELVVVTCSRSILMSLTSLPGIISANLHSYLSAFAPTGISVVDVHETEVNECSSKYVNEYIGSMKADITNNDDSEAAREISTSSELQTYLDGILATELSISLRVLQILVKILRNIQNNPKTPKFKCINKNSKVFIQMQDWSSDSIIHVIHACGFEADANKEDLKYTRDDVGYLCTVADIVAMLIECFD